MRIGIDARPLISNRPSGIGRYLINILKQFQKQNIDDVYLYSNEPLNYHQEITSSFNVRIVPGKPGSVWCCHMLGSHLVADGIDVFWGTEHMIPLNVPGIRTVLTVHDLALLVNPSWGHWKNAAMQNIFARQSCKKADHIIADSRWTKWDIKRLIKRNGEDITVIYPGIENSVDTDSIKTIDSKYFLFIGSIEPRKNVEGVIKGFERFCDKMSKEYGLIIAGSVQPGSEKVIELARKSKYAKHIKILGYVSDEKRAVLLKNATALLFPSLYEGFGFPVLEGYTYGIPVITSYGTSLKEVGGKNAVYIYRPHSHEELARAMKEVTGYSERRRAKLSEDEKLWTEKFSWDKCAEETLKVILGN